MCVGGEGGGKEISVLNIEVFLHVFQGPTIERFCLMQFLSTCIYIYLCRVSSIRSLPDCAKSTPGKGSLCRSVIMLFEI